MNDLIPNGVWPTMITPFTKNNEVDYEALAALVEWYIQQGVDGLFAVCQSSEMYYLSLHERTQIASFVKEKTEGRVPVIASGHVSDDMDEQIYELKAMTDTGIDALVIISNHFAKQDENDAVWKMNADKVLQAVSDIPLGIYECPVPYKRLMSPDLLRWCAESGRFHFLKDTCCDIEQLRIKNEAVQGSPLKIFNANSTILLDSLKMGIAGFSGVMANFHAYLYVWLDRNWFKELEKAKMIQDFLGMVSLAECQAYPVNAKYHLKLEGVPIELYSRTRSYEEFSSSDQLAIEQLYRFTHEFIDKWLYE
jgi:4-hydroxy-tetrahydrodipicolinate synthase